MATAYEILGVPETASADELRAAHRRAAAAAHPDRNGGDDERSKLISRAWALLGTPEARAMYDARLARRRGQSDPLAELEQGARRILGEAHRAVDALGTLAGDPRVRAAGEAAAALLNLRKELVR